MFRFLSLTVCFLVVTQNSWAQTFTDTTNTLNEIVVSANKTEEPKKTIAQQVHVLSEKEIQQLQAQTTSEVLSNTGNVYIQKSQMGGGSITLRGFEANRMLLVVDGVRMNNLIYRSGHLQNCITLDNNSLERIEVLYGPSSTIYGSDALGGVVHFQTKRPKFAPDTARKHISLNAFSRFGSVNNERTTHVDLNFGKNKIAFLTSFTYSSFGDLLSGKNKNPFYTQPYGLRTQYATRINEEDTVIKNANPYLQKGSAYNQGDFIQKIALKPSAFSHHGINIQYSSSSDIPRYDRLTDPSGTGLRFSEWYYGPQKRFLAAYDYNRKKATSFFQSIHYALHYQQVKESRITRRFNNPNRDHRIEEVAALGTNLDFNRKSTKHNFRFGLEALANTLNSSAFSQNIFTGVKNLLDTRYPDGTNYMFTTALYVSDTWYLTKKTTLNEGVRVGYTTLYSSFIDTSFFNFPFSSSKQNTPVCSGSIGMTHNPSDKLKLSLLVSSGFRVPNVDDLSKIFESSPGKIIIPNANLRPEKTINYEIGIVKLVRRFASWENVFYYTRLFDAIIVDRYTYKGQDSILYDNTNSQVFANQNKGRAYVYGVSSNLHFRFSQAFTAGLNANYTYGRIKTDSVDQPLDHIPPLLIRFKVGYSYKNFNADFFVNANGQKKLSDYKLNGEDNENYATPIGMPAWFTLNSRIYYSFFRDITAMVGIDNILDTQYRTFASGINAPGRNIFASLRYRF